MKTVSVKDRVSRQLRCHPWRRRSRPIPCWPSWKPTRRYRATPTGSRLGWTKPRWAASGASLWKDCGLEFASSATELTAVAHGPAPSPPQRAAEGRAAAVIASSSPEGL